MKRTYADHGDACRAANALDLVGDRWTLIVIRELILAPKRFADLEDYYARASVGPELGHLAIPALYIAAKHDPMVPAFAVESLSTRLPAGAISGRAV